MNKNEIKWAKTKLEGKIPSKRIEDAGYDIYALFEESYLLIEPHQTVLIPTGIASAFHESKVALLQERGSTGTKGFGQRCGVIDSGYRGEWMVPLTNHNTCDVFIAKEVVRDKLTEKFPDAIVYPYEKAICQAVFLDVPVLTCSEVSYEELKEISSDRGTGKLGSSGK